ncbi:MAG: twin-arginine translocation signal domain-containing protein [Acidobacteriaceae bacterium]
MLTRRRFLGYSALATAALRPGLWSESLLQGPGADHPPPHISARAWAIQERTLVFDAHVHALDREFYHGGSMGTRTTRANGICRARGKAE